MVTSKFTAVINQICEEKGIPEEKVIEIIENALMVAYRKDYGKKGQDITVKFNKETGEAKVFISKEVVEKIDDELTQISLEEAKKIKKDAKIGEKLTWEVTPSGYGRIAAQTAKQVIIQRIKEAERDVMFNEFKNKEKTLANGVVQQIKNDNVFIDLGKITAVMFPSERISTEKYYPGQRIRAYIIQVEQSSKGPQILVSRSHPEFLRKLFELEIPEISAGTVEIKSIAREAGSRSKVAVYSNDSNIDPVGSCVGQRGMRIQAILSELGKEKIDIVLWDSDPAKYIANALSPAKVDEIKIDKKKKEAKVKVPDDQLSLAIGKGGQNVRLVAKLTNWKVDIEGSEKISEKTDEENKISEPKEKKSEVKDRDIKEIKEGEVVKINSEGNETQ